jgi:hypothetical protein
MMLPISRAFWFLRSFFRFSRTALAGKKKMRFVEEVAAMMMVVVAVVMMMMTTTTTMKMRLAEVVEKMMLLLYCNQNHVTAPANAFPSKCCKSSGRKGELATVFFKPLQPQPPPLLLPYLPHLLYSLLDVPSPP